MKPTHLILTAFLAASTLAQAATVDRRLPAPLPEFKTPEQLAQWREEKAAQANSPSQIPNSSFVNAGAFFTGKPYLEESGTYAFLFRSYDPELNRWTSQDLVGFLDGANNYRYTPIPTNSFDFLGLLDWATLQRTGVTNTASHPSGYSWSYEIYTIKPNDQNHTIHMWKNLQPWDKPGGTTNCHGFTFGNGEFWINPEWVSSIIAGDGYKLITGSDKTGARVALWPDKSAEHSAKVTEVVSGGVKKVTGIGGIQTIPSTTSPDLQWAGPVEYYE